MAADKLTFKPSGQVESEPKKADAYLPMTSAPKREETRDEQLIPSSRVIGGTVPSDMSYWNWPQSKPVRIDF